MILSAGEWAACVQDKCLWQFVCLGKNFIFVYFEDLYALKYTYFQVVAYIKITVEVSLNCAVLAANV